MNDNIKHYKTLLHDIKQRARQGQLRASLSANAEMLAAYWDIGQMIHERQQKEGWGAGVIPRLASDLKNELSDVKGFTERNLKFMVQFYKEYVDFPIGKLPVSQLENQILPVAENKDPQNGKLTVSHLKEIKKSITQLPVAKLQNIEIQSNLISLTGWAHHIILIQQVKELPSRYWYMQQCIINGWSRDTLVQMIKARFICDKVML